MARKKKGEKKYGFFGYDIKVSKKPKGRKPFWGMRKKKQGRKLSGESRIKLM